VPFQWSLHRVDGYGAIEHREFLADGRVDPRPAFVESLVAALSGSSDPIAVYSGFEDGVLGDLATVVPARADELSALRARLVDLLRIVRRHVYHPAFGGLYSVKVVAPALVPGFGYDDLTEIADGHAASDAFAAMARGAASDADGIRRALLAYCGRDTLAMVEVHRALRARVA